LTIQILGQIFQYNKLNKREKHLACSRLENIRHIYEVEIGGYM
jgi:hypothetical protein